MKACPSRGILARHRSSYGRVATAKQPSRAVSVAAHNDLSNCTVSRECSSLVQWVQQNRGYLHEGLQVIERASCGTRGVIATRDISEEEAATMPLAAIPQFMEVTDSISKDALLPIIPESAAGMLQDMDGGALVVLFLALQRSQGEGSVLAPYIDSLPQEVSCPWNWSKSQVEEALLRSGLPGDSMSEWHAEVQKATNYVTSVSQGLWNDFGQHIGVSPQDLRWALGIVASRGYGGDQRPGLIPFIDLFNHDKRASPFYLQMLQVEVDETEGQGGESGRPFYTVWSTCEGQPKALEAGEEVYVDYKMGGMTPVDVFLSHGFIPPEMRSSIAMK